VRASAAVRIIFDRRLFGTIVLNQMSSEKEILTNRQAYHEYHILEKFEAGAVLLGTEVKSIMLGRIQLKESYVSLKDGEIWLIGAHVSHYSHGNINNHDVLRERKLLLHSKEIAKLEKETTQKGMTLVVTRIYWKNGRIKFEIGVAKGKKLYDKREAEMKKTVEKETRQELKRTLR
jgi:SsrA-binding protein